MVLELGGGSAIIYRKLDTTTAPFYEVVGRVSANPALRNVGRWNQTLGAGQGGYALFDTGIALPADGEVHRVRVVDQTNENAGTVLITLADLITAPASANQHTSATTTGLNFSGNAMRFPIGQNRGYALGRSTRGNYLFGNFNASAVVSLSVDRLV